MKKTLTIITTFSLLCLLVACGSDTGNYFDGLTEPYNENLFFRNDLEVRIADPSVIYITEGKEAGYFYLYGTTDQLSATGIYAYRTKNFNDWQLMGPAFVPHKDSWGISSIWAPEVIYMNEKYYMYYSATNRFNNNLKGLGVAVSDSPYGPFEVYEGTTIDNREITVADQPFDVGFKAIDVSPFIDTNGDFYLYFSKDQVDGISSIWGVKMLDPVTPDLSTLKQLTQPSFRSMDAYENAILRFGQVSWEHANDSQGYVMWNEGPFMYEKDGVYFLSYSANPYWSREYAVGYATSNSPLGDFVKPEDNRILGVDTNWDHMSGTGHHVFFEAGDELFVAYHAHQDRVFGNSSRAVAFDRVFINEDELYINGPTYSLQPLPEIITGYKNIAKDATFEATNTLDVEKLNDNIVAMHYKDASTQMDVETGSTTITIKFDSEKLVRALLIYNSVDYETAFFEIESINVSNQVKIKNLGFNNNYINREFPDFPEMRPGGAFIAEFNETTTKEITITIKQEGSISIPEIVILGK
ncbi:glycoside hydrolase family 43 protein [Acholeplasma granularum]|uniref:glycoside hydrolase family 43 protein n=1 Tax=Acholeplasma granularum TaxID=264635 RepID=UPI00046FEF15|nr:glycoside hydrolase family 43 protein [Acholeplasma granularum]